MLDHFYPQILSILDLVGSELQTSYWLNLLYTSKELVKWLSSVSYHLKNNKRGPFKQLSTVYLQRKKFHNLKESNVYSKKEVEKKLKMETKLGIWFVWSNKLVNASVGIDCNGTKWAVIIDDFQKLHVLIAQCHCHCIPIFTWCASKQWKCFISFSSSFFFRSK